MATLKYGEYTVEYKLFEGNVQIVDSYKIRKKADMKGILAAVRAAAKEAGYTYKRTNSSWLAEWRAHNYMYDKKIQRSRTASVDLNEEENRSRRLVYRLLSILYRP